MIDRILLAYLINFVFSVLTIKAHRKHDYTTKDLFGNRQLERSYGSYLRSIELPSAANIDASSASFANGVLAVSFKKKSPEDIAAIVKKIELK